MTVGAPPRAAARLDFELERLRLLLQRRILWLRAWWGSDPLHGAGALLVSDARVDALLRRPGPEDETAFYNEDPEAERLTDAIVEVDAALAHGERSPLDRLAAFVGLDDLELRLLVLALAPELDPAFERLFAYVQDDASRRFATPQLAAELLGEEARVRLAAPGRLRRLGLLNLEPAADAGWGSRPVRADERVLDMARGLDHVDERLLACAVPVDDPAPVGTQAELAERLADYLAGRPRRPVVHLRGEPDSGTRSIAAMVCRHLGLTLVAVTATGQPDLAELLDREALLMGLAFYIEDDAGPEARTLVQRLASPVFVGGARPLPAEMAAITVAVAAPAAPEQEAVWAELVPSLDAAEAGRLVEQFDLGPPRIAAATRAAETAAALRGEDRPRPEDLWEACREQSRLQADGLARPIIPSARWEQLVLPEDALAQLEEIAAQVSNRRVVYDAWGFGPRIVRGRGISALFAGPSGTGKTMAAEVLAERLRLDLYRIDLAGVVSKWIGETEKNLRSVFDSAERSGAILFFDEAEALFGKRTEVKDAHDRYANIEVDYLLQRMEEYRGLAILATNQRALLDPAFLRRLRFVVEFPFPDPAARARLWEGVFPPEAPVGELDLEALSRLEVSGGSIRTIALNAAFLAAATGEQVGMDHVMRAARREYTKLEKLIAQGEFGSWT